VPFGSELFRTLRQGLRQRKTGSSETPLRVKTDTVNFPCLLHARASSPTAILVMRQLGP
jgi:hypothetical protein